MPEPLSSPRLEEDALKALDQVPRERSGARARRGTLTQPSSKITEGELKNIELALLNPPARVNWATAITSVVGAAYAAVKALNANGSLDGAGIWTFGVSLLVIGGVGAVTLRQLSQKHPHHDQALRDVQQLMAEPTEKA